MTAAPEAPAGLQVVRQAIEHCHAQGWTDGLPVVPATQADVAEFLATVDRDPDEVIGAQEHLDRRVTVAQAAVNAVMAGCLPEYFPLVLAAWEAVREEPSSRGGAWQSTSGPAPLLVVNGPIRTELGVNCAGGVLGPGFRANATVGRALGLLVRNGYGIKPQELEQATQGVPGRWTLCIGENEELSPWEPFSVAGGVPAGTSAVSAMLIRDVEYVDNRHTEDVEALLRDFADTLARTGAYLGMKHSTGGLVLGPEHAQVLAAAGYSRADVQQWLFEHAVRPQADLVAAGKESHDVDPGPDPMPMMPSAAEIPIVVAGAANAAISAVFRPFGWATWSGRSVPVPHSCPSPSRTEESAP
ncbi:hypothetical protein [Modestobacter sp. SYSU DS0875]